MPPAYRLPVPFASTLTKIRERWDPSRYQTFFAAIARVSAMDSSHAEPNDDARDALLRAQEEIDRLTAVLAEERAQHRRSLPGTRDGNHEALLRFRNLTAIIRSVFQRTADTADTLDDMARHFMGRFDVLARLGVAAAEARMFELEDVIRDELLTLREADGPRTRIAGPPVALDPRQMPLIGLAIHELAVNSIKYGALASEDANLAIEWSINENSDHAVDLTWIETGVAIVAAAPLRNGFGRQFIEQALPYQMNARTIFKLKPGGILCRMTLPDVRVATSGRR